MSKILIAEDDKFLASAYKAKLAKSGYEVEVVGDGIETLSSIKKYLPDILLLDLIMPKKDGFAVLGEIRANPQLAKLPVIVASNLGQKEDLDKAIAFGANAYFVKSDSSLDDLIAKIHTFIK